MVRGRNADGSVVGVVPMPGSSRFGCLSLGHTQRAQYPLIKEYTSNPKIKAPKI